MITTAETYHVPVLLKESVDGLDIKPDGIYVDVTFGGGGHSREILSRLGKNGHLYSFDQDEDAERNILNDNRFTFVRSNFRYLRNWMRYYHVEQIDGLLADLGVSSHHFDDETRGFSFRFDAPLDMRMNKRSGTTAAEILNNYNEDQLADIFYIYGELKNARRIASAIVKARLEKAIETTADLMQATESLFQHEREKKETAKLFQALRIEVNHEMDALKEMLYGAQEVLREGVRAYPKEWDQQLFYIQYLVYLEDLEAASDAADAAYAENPGDVRYLELKNYLDYQRKDYEGLLRNSEKIMEMSPKGSDAYISAYANMGDIYHEMGRDKEAFKIYKKVLKLKPDYAPTLNNYAFYLSQQGKQLGKAYKMSKKTIEQEPDNGTYLDTFGWILHKLGRNVEAKPIFKQALLYGSSDSAVILDHYAKVLEALGETELARVYWRQALTKAGDEDAELKESIRRKLDGK